MSRRLVALACAMSFLAGVLVGSCGHTVTVSAFDGLIEVRVEPAVAAKLEGLTPEELRGLLYRGMTTPELPDPADKPVLTEEGSR